MREKAGEAVLGYVRAYKPDLRVKEYELYRGVYCSLCRNLGRRYSPLAQLFLSYDFTLAALLTLALQEEPCCFRACRCPYNPAKRCLKCGSAAAIDRCADGVIITVYYKIRDNLHDKGIISRLGALLLYPAVSLMHRKAARLFPQGEKAVNAAMQKQRETEQKENCLLDEAADPSATALGAIFAADSAPENRQLLQTLGYMVGRYVYILDAADDLPGDIQKGNFNPFAKDAPDFADKEQTKAFARRVVEMLNLTQSEAASALEQLQTKRFGDLLYNIIISGLDASAAKALSQYTEKAKHQKKPREFSV